MWNSIQAVNSFVFWPLSIIFMIYSIGRFLLFWDWKILIFGIFGFAIITGLGMILGILAD